jgi:hypothetical protein
MHKIVIINGMARAGKDSVAVLSTNFAFVENVSSVDLIYEFMNLMGWNGEKDERTRKFMSDLKLLMTEYNDIPFKYLMDKINEFKITIKGMKEPCIIYLQVREPNEIQKLKEYYGEECVTLIVKNKNIIDITSNMADANVNNYEYDHVINNDGTLKDLKIAVESFVNAIF